MFLKEFNTEEANAFINLVNLFSEIDEVVNKEERRLIKDYLNEMNLSENETRKFTYKEVMDIFKKSKERIKRIVYFELVGLALIDGNYGDKEVDYLDMIAIDLDINRAQKIEFANYFYNFKEIHDFSIIETKSEYLENLREEAESLL